MEDYKDIKDMLTPRRDFAASDELRNRIDSTLDSYTGKRKPFRWIYGVSTSCIAAVVLILFFLPTGMSAKKILSETIDVLINCYGIEMEVDVRTRPMENFRYINLSENFVKHIISIAKTDSTISWRIDKEGRTATGNNRVVYNWIRDLNIGWQTDDVEPKNLIGEMAIFLTPEKILESELQNCINNTDAHYDIDRKGDEIILTVHSQPQGDFGNPYMLNASIAESENIRRYVIDAGTKQLKIASVSIVKGTIETEVLKIKNIIYCRPRTDLMALPSGVRFINMPQNSLQGLAGLTATEVASVFLHALETWNVSILDIAVDENMKNILWEQDLKGSVLVSVGKSFNSGNEGTVFVPYELRLPDGSKKRHNLVLQRMSHGGWIVAGGL